MRLGMLLRSGWRDERARDEPPARAFANMMLEAEAALGEGVTSLWVYDHLHAVPSAPEAPFFEAWTTLAAAAQRLRPNRLGPLVSNVGFRNVGLLAKMAATVDAASGGRLVLGLGAGWYRDELTRFGYPTRPFTTRVRAVEEAIDAIRSLWSGASTTTRSGSLMDALSSPAPPQGTSLPIWLGGSSERMQELAAFKADGINFGGSPSELRERIEGWRRKCASAGRDPSSSTVSTEVQVLLDPEPAALAARAQQSGASVTEFAAANIVGSETEVAQKAARYAGAGVDELITFLPLAATPEAVRRTVGLLREGVEGHA